MFDILVIGYGSIGRKHVENILKLNLKPVVFTKYPSQNKSIKFIETLDGLTDVKHCIIATPTAKHHEDFFLIASKTGCKDFLIEKPLDMNIENAKLIYDIAQALRIRVRIAYDMRFLKVFDVIKNVITNVKTKIRLVKIEAGQYLPDWRPSRNYRLSYSANKAQGGGVDLDLSHEIDYMHWLFGMPNAKLFISKNKISLIEIDSCDYFKGIYQYDTFIVDVELDYIRKAERFLKIIGENVELLFIDFINKSVFINGEKLKDDSLFENDVYVEEIEEFLGISPQNKLCSIEDGIKVLALIN